MGPRGAIVPKSIFYCGRTGVIRVFCFAALVGMVVGHGALYHPTPRNAMDNVLPEYAGGKSPTQGCTCTNGNGNGATEGCDMGLRATADGAFLYLRPCPLNLCHRPLRWAGMPLVVSGLLDWLCTMHDRGRS